MEFQKFNKIPRLSRDMIITEKIDGSNGQVFIAKVGDFLPMSYFEHEEFFKKYCLSKTNIDGEDLFMFAGSRTRWLEPSSNGDNFGFAEWVTENAEELIKLGPGRHYGEWYGKGIQRNYGLDHRRFALFNIKKWVDNGLEVPEGDKRQVCPECCEVVPILWEALFNTDQIDRVLRNLKDNGSFAVPGYMNPEGICIFHKAAGQLFKKTIEGDEKPKSL